MNILMRFIVYGCTGWIIETVFTGLSSALDGDKNLKCHTYLWMFPIYGLGILLEPLHEIMRGLLWVYRGFVWVAAIFLIEYVTGWIIKLIIGECPWDYDVDGEILVSVKGIIRLDFLPVWFAVGLMFERLHDFVRAFV